MTNKQPTHTPRPGYKRTALGWIPEEWEVVKLEQVIKKLEAGVSVNGEDRPLLNDEIGVLKVSSVSYGILNVNEVKVVEGNERNLAKVNPRKNSILISRANTPELVGATVFVKEDFPNLFLPDKLWQTVFDKKRKVHPLFIFFSLNSDRLRFRISNVATGSSGSMKNISKSSFLSLKLPLPPLPEQRRIAAILATWDRAIELTQQLIAAKTQQKRALMQQLLTGRVRVPGFVKDKNYRKTKIGLVPNDWGILKSSEIFKNISIKNNEDEPLLAVTQENGVIPRDMLEGRVMMPSGDTKSYKLVIPGNFVISLRSFQGGIEYSEYRGIVSPAYTILTNRIPIDENFFRYFFKSKEFISRLSVAVIGIRDGKQISFSDFSAMSFRYPPLEEQTAIARILTTADAELALLERRLAALQAQKRGLMQVLLTGKIRVKL